MSVIFVFFFLPFAAFRIKFARYARRSYELYRYPGRVSDNVPLRLNFKTYSSLEDQQARRRRLAGISSKTDGRTKAEGLSFYHPGHQTAWVRC